jgi:hypothetical protein
MNPAFPPHPVRSHCHRRGPDPTRIGRLPPILAGKPRSFLRAPELQAHQRPRSRHGSHAARHSARTRRNRALARRDPQTDAGRPLCRRPDNPIRRSSLGRGPASLKSQGMGLPLVGTHPCSVNKRNPHTINNRARFVPERSHFSSIFNRGHHHQFSKKKLSQPLAASTTTRYYHASLGPWRNG